MSWRNDTWSKDISTLLMRIKKDYISIGKSPIKCCSFTKKKNEISQTTYLVLFASQIWKAQLLHIFSAVVLKGVHIPNKVCIQRWKEKIIEQSMLEKVVCMNGMQRLRASIYNMYRMRNRNSLMCKYFSSYLNKLISN